MNRIQKELETIRKRNKGVLRPEDVVKFAKDKKTALHTQFEWSDTKAAKKYRLYQARQVILQVKIIPHPEAGTVTRAYVSLKDDRTMPGGGYRAVVDVLTDADRRAALMREALEELVVFRQKYKTLSELEPVFAAIAQVAKKKRRKTG